MCGLWVAKGATMVLADATLTCGLKFRVPAKKQIIHEFSDYFNLNGILGKSDKRKKTATKTCLEIRQAVSTADTYLRFDFISHICEDKQYH